MLTVRNLTAGYGAIEIIRNISFDVHAGEVVTIIGANGAGKTTTLKTLCGVIKAKQGSIMFNDIALSSLSTNAIVDLGMTMIPEGRQLFPFLSVKDNLLIGAFKSTARPKAQQKMAEVLTLFPQLTAKLGRYAGSLSGGEQQMVAIARGLMSAPKLLIFDEPSLGLSPLLVEQMFETIAAIIKQGVTVLIVEQNIFNTLALAHRGYVLENGEISLTGSGQELLNNDYVKKAYLGL